MLKMVEYETYLLLFLLLPPRCFLYRLPGHSGTHTITPIPLRLRLSTQPRSIQPLIFDRHTQPAGRKERLVPHAHQIRDLVLPPARHRTHDCIRREQAWHEAHAQRRVRAEVLREVARALDVAVLEQPRDVARVHVVCEQELRRGEEWLEAAVEVRALAWDAEGLGEERVGAFGVWRAGESRWWWLQRVSV
ncbi:hypothetical protein DENSPDRAFT_126343 [Dentipellis sp. KUC8613]|nr:hypothetical protein DENSPDRAFT_126343 [Dentipellis sp. KUC8613]